MRSFSRSLLKKASESIAGRSKDGGVGQYGNYVSEEVAANDIFNRGLPLWWWIRTKRRKVDSRRFVFYDRHGGAGEELCHWLTEQASTH